MELLANTWYVIIGFCIIMYVLLDGFDLGIGILFPFFAEGERDVMLASILPVWDGNQTWLVFGVACFYGAFPLAFSILIPALYLPLFIMVIGLLLRGITFEFRLKEKIYPWLWNYILFLSSIVVCLSQGILLGSFVQGFQLGPEHRLIFSLLTPFNMICGIALIFGYALLGSTWVIAKTEGNIQKKMYAMTKYFLWIVAFFLCVISLWSPFVNPIIWHRWFAPEHFYKVLTLPCFTASIIVYFNYCIQKRKEYILYVLTVLIFLCSYAGFAISTWPYIIPHQINIMQAAAPPSSQLFMLIGTLILLPILIGYTAYAYYIFRGKVTKSSIGY